MSKDSHHPALSHLHRLTPSASLHSSRPTSKATSSRKLSLVSSLKHELPEPLCSHLGFQAPLAHTRPWLWLSCLPSHSASLRGPCLFNLEMFLTCLSWSAFHEVVLAVGVQAGPSARDFPLNLLGDGTRVFSPLGPAEKGRQGLK